MEIMLNSFYYKNKFKDRSRFFISASLQEICNLSDPLFFLLYKRSDTSFCWSHIFSTFKALSFRGIISLASSTSLLRFPISENAISISFFLNALFPWFLQINSNLTNCYVLCNVMLVLNWLWKYFPVLK